MSSLDKSISSISDLYKSLNVITELLKDINNVVKDDIVTKKKIDEAIKTFTKISTQTTKILSFVKSFDFATVQSTMKDLQAHALIQEEALAAWMNHPESSQEAPTIDKGKGIATETEEDPSNKLVPASTIIRPDPDEPDKKEKMKKDAEEAKLLAMSRPEVIKSLNKPHPKPQEERESIWNWNMKSRCMGWNVIGASLKVGVDSLVSYLVMASMVKSEENAIFSLKLRKLIADHPDQEKLKSKKVKLEALGYHVE
nr:hypothetical protein [Tanacetum cinerariifolium]